MTLDTNIITELRIKLKEDKTRLEKELEIIGKPTESKDGYETVFNNIGTHEDENATEVEEYTDNLAIENSLEAQLKDVNKALVKIDNNLYGKCEKCDKNIDIERLKAYPSAKNCIECN